MGVAATSKVVTSSNRVSRAVMIQPGNREWVTVIECVNASGWSLPPFVILSSKAHQSSWYRDLPLDWTVGVSDNGWTTDELGFEWVKHFNQHTAARTAGVYRLLIVDGHSSHATPEFDRYCADNKIITLCMPPHTSHLLQPLDIATQTETPHTVAELQQKVRYLQERLRRQPESPTSVAIRQLAKSAQLAMQSAAILVEENKKLREENQRQRYKKSQQRQYIASEGVLQVQQAQQLAAWRGRRTVSLISFDVKGAYNGVCKERLLQRMKARGIPQKLLQWVEAFCSGRTASIQVNGQTSETRELPQAGLPQGSPLSPILFLFFNADLVQRRIDTYGGAIAFVDDFTAWVTGPTAQSNREGIKTIISDALDWERRSGATFEAEKTAVIHFTKKAYKSATEPFLIKGQSVSPKDHVKILGVLMDARLKYHKHIARAAAKGLEAALELRRLRGLSPAVARQLFTTTVAPTVDYASNVWMHAFKDRVIGPINRVQRVGAQAIIGTFSTVATWVTEAEAHIPSAQERFWKRAVKLWTDIHALPETNPLRRNTSRMRRFRKQHRSPLYQVADALKSIEMEQMETIRPCVLAPWEKRVQIVTENAVHLQVRDAFM
ncbi:reverse transcriptase [Stemphylium lycopersici]|uniref:Reverse transcriptase n=1 Tax=Stemphylium lycopersici TaxID=183478 RepID=A0A364MS13_STELY|nr:reverse transcriptase [Stemphylium lycopersici]RAQ98672.1 reverse transcriptase [Stemphylium lycopersici]RAR00686.1 reverse transcriptase [Stemphylium lycopersici]